MLLKVLCVFLNSVGFCLCSFLALRRSLHVFQLNSYQYPSYRRFLRQNPDELMGLGRTLPLALTFLVNIFAFGLIPLWVLYSIANRYGTAKKPLVYTPRVKRMMVTAGALTALLIPGIARLAFCRTDCPWLPRILFSLLPCLWVLLQPWLVMAYNGINRPVEGHISRGYIKDAARILKEHPGLTIIGITGSYGKTSVKYYLYELLGVQHNVYMTPGNYNTLLGVVRAIREGLRPVHDIFLCEMGARHPHDIQDICDLVHPQLGILTAIGEQHLETFGSQKIITRTKRELADAVEGGGTLFYNIDSPILAAQTFGGKQFSYGQSGNAGYRISDLITSAKGSSFTLHTPMGEMAVFKTRLLGCANVQNLCGAIAVAHYLGISLNRLVPAVAMVKAVPHRLELKSAGGMTLIDDAYNANPQGAAVAMETLSMMEGTRIAVTPGLVELGEREQALNYALGQQAAGCCHWLVTVGKNPGGYVAAGAREAGLENVYEAADINQGLAWVRSLAATDKVVLLLNDLPDQYR